MTTSAIVGFSGEHRFLSMAYPLDKPVVEKIGPAKFRYPTLRKAYHAHRTNDQYLKAIIIRYDSTKDVSQVVTQDDEREDWPLLRERVLYRLLKQKFSDRGLRARLIKTAPATLIHWDDSDLFWGKDRLGNGENRLGALLMRLRTEFTSTN